MANENGQIYNLNELNLQEDFFNTVSDEQEILFQVYFVFNKEQITGELNNTAQCEINNFQVNGGNSRKKLNVKLKSVNYSDLKSDNYDSQGNQLVPIFPLSNFTVDNILVLEIQDIKFEKNDNFSLKIQNVENKIEFKNILFDNIDQIVSSSMESIFSFRNSNRLQFLGVQFNNLTHSYSGEIIDQEEELNNYKILEILNIPNVLIQNSSFSNINKLTDGENPIPQFIYIYQDENDGEFTLKNTKFSNIHGGALKIENSNKIRVENSQFQENKIFTELGGAGLYIDQIKSLTFQNITADNNYSKNYGGFLFLQYAEFFTIKNSTFQNNQVDIFSGGALQIQKISKKLLIENSQFTENICVIENEDLESRGGAIDLYCFVENEDPFDFILSNNTFQYNQAQNQGGAIMILNQIYVNISFYDNYFKGNYANIGGALAIIYFDNFVSNNEQYIENEAYEEGGAYSIYEQSSEDKQVKIYNGSFIGNIAVEYSAGIALAMCYNIEIVDVVIEDNQLELFSGGGFNAFNCFTLVFRNSILRNNLVKGEGGRGGGLELYQIPDIQFIDSQIVANSAGNGAGIFLTYCDDFLIKNSTIENNFGGGIEFKSSNNITIIDSRSRNNSVRYTGGGGFYFNKCTDIILNNVDIVQNQANFKEGGGILIDYCKNINISESKIEENQGHLGGGFRIINSNGILVEKTNVQDNQGLLKGSGFYIQDCKNVSIQSSQFINNKVKSGSGGGVYFENSNDIYLDENEFNGNKVQNYGGAILFTESLNIVLNSCSVENNIASKAGGGLYFYKNQNENKDQNSLISIEKSIFKNNASKEGGAIYGKMIENINLTNSTFFNNSAIYGGGIYLQTVLALVINENIANNNIVNIQGGFASIRDSEKLMVQNSTFIHNIAKSDGGGAFFVLKNKQIQILNSKADSNFANLTGGFIHIDKNQEIFQINKSLFTNNTCFLNESLSNSQKMENYVLSKGGSIYYTSGLSQQKEPKIKIQNAQFIKNKASSGGAILFHQNKDLNLQFSFQNLKFEKCIADIGSSIRFLGKYEKIINKSLISSVGNINILRDINLDAFDIQYGYITNEEIQDDYDFELCKQGTYNKQNDDKECQICPSNSICQGGYYPLFPKQEYWRNGILSYDIQYCQQNPQSCIGNDTCQNGYMGIYCEGCDVIGGFFKNDIQKCSHCQNDIYIMFILLGKMLAVFFIVILSFKTFQNIIYKKQLQKIMAAFNYRIYQNYNIASVLKIVIIHGQILALSQQVYYQIPVEFTAIVNYFGGQLGVLSSNLECLFKDSISEEDVKYVKVYSVIFGYLIASILLTILIFCIVIWCLGQKRTKNRGMIQQYSVSVALCYFVNFQPGFILTSAQSLLCRKVGNEFFTLNNFQLECGTDWGNNVLNGIVFVSFMIFIPLYLYRNLKKANEQKLLKTRVYFMRQYGILFLEYKDRYFYWEFISMLQKYFIVLIFNGYNNNQSISYGLSSLVIFIYIACLANNEPYTSTKINKLAILSSSIQFISLVLGLSIIDFSYDGYFTDLKEVIKIVIVSINVLFFLAAGLFAFYEKFLLQNKVVKKKINHKKSDYWKLVSKLCISYVQQGSQLRKCDQKDTIQQRNFIELGKDNIKMIRFIQQVQSFINKKRKIMLQECDKNNNNTNTNYNNEKLKQFLFLQKLKKLQVLNSFGEYKQISRGCNSFNTEHDGNFSFYEDNQNNHMQYVKVQDYQEVQLK